MSPELGRICLEGELPKEEHCKVMVHAQWVVASELAKNCQLVVVAVHKGSALWNQVSGSLHQRLAAIALVLVFLQP